MTWGRIVVAAKIAAQAGKHTHRIAEVGRGIDSALYGKGVEHRDEIKHVADTVADDAGQAIHAVKDIASIVDNSVDHFGADAGKIAQQATQDAQAAVQVAARVAESVEEHAVNDAKVAADAIEHAAEVVGQAIENAAETVGHAVENVADKVGDAFKKL